MKGAENEGAGEMEEVGGKVKVSTCGERWRPKCLRAAAESGCAAPYQAY